MGSCALFRPRLLNKTSMRISCIRVKICCMRPKLLSRPPCYSGMPQRLLNMPYDRATDTWWRQTLRLDIVWGAISINPKSTIPFKTHILLFYGGMPTSIEGIALHEHFLFITGGVVCSFPKSLSAKTICPLFLFFFPSNITTSC